MPPNAKIQAIFISFLSLLDIPAGNLFILFDGMTLALNVKNIIVLSLVCRNHSNDRITALFF